MESSALEKVNGKQPQEKKKRARRQPPPLPSQAGASEMSVASYECKVETTPTNWDSLPIWSAFSLSSDGSYPQVKVSRRQYCDLRTGKSFEAGSGRCYRVIF